MDDVAYVLPVKYISGGKLVAEQGWIHGRRKLDTSVLLVVEKGHFVLFEDDHRIEINEHEAVILQAGHEHRGVRDSNDIAPVYCWAHFIDGSGSQTLKLPQKCASYDYRKTITYFHQLLSEAREKKESCSVLYDYMLSLVLLSLNTPVNTKGDEKSLCVSIKEFIKCNYRHNITLNELASHFLYSEDYISRVFRTGTGMSFREYLHIKRIEEAKRLLATTSDTLQEIAIKCGYENEKFFMTKFKQCTGITATQYRNNSTSVHVNNF